MFDLSNRFQSTKLVRDLLETKDYTLKMAIIDGELTFPDELPSDQWSEIRVRTPAGMISIRRTQNQIDAVTWENADAPMMQAYNAITWAYASIGNGKINTDSGSLTANEFYDSADLPTGF